MIQRIQTLFLLAAFGLLLSLFFIPMATSGEGIIKTYLSDYIFLTFLIITALLSFITLFLYRKRILQIRLCTFNAIVLTAMQGVLVYYFFTWNSTWQFSVSAVFPIVALICVILARRNIVRDEAMVRAADRLR